jgi:hypothetical protein
MHLIEVFRASLSLMKREPKVFVPRVFTTFLNTFFVLYAARLSLEISLAINREIEIARSAGAAPEIGGILSPFAGELSLFASLFLFVYVVDILTYGMYVMIASDFHAGRPISLVRALRDAVSRARALLLIGILATAFVGCFIVVYLLLGRLYISTQNPLFLLAALVVMLLAIVLFALVFFFAVPVAMVERRGVKSAVLKSASLGRRYKSPVLKTNFLFVGMVFVAMVAVMLTEFQGALALGAILLFVSGRLFQALIYTYISIVNPSLYLSIDEVER